MICAGHYEPPEITEIGPDPSRPRKHKSRSQPDSNFGTCNRYLIMLSPSSVLTATRHAFDAFRHVAEQHEAPADGKPDGNMDALSEAESRIIEVIRDAGHRLTTDQVLRELENRHGAASIGTTKVNLATLVRRRLLTNRQDVSPKGYGLPGGDLPREPD